MGTIDETLDPENWEEFREIAHSMLDRVIDWQRDLRDGPVWQSVPERINDRFKEPAPIDGLGARAAADDFFEMVLPYPTGTAHPRFWGWACGAGTPMGMLAAMAGAATNSAPGNFDDAATRVENQLLAWMKSAMGFPARASGIVTSGGSVANLIGLAVARDQASARIGAEGVGAVGPLVLYASSEVHSSVFKAAALLGLGRSALRVVPVDRDYRISLPGLTARIARDREAGFVPFAVVGTAGTINTGSIDDLAALAEIAAAERLWFHVDGAFGAMAALSPETRGRVAGLERADSLAFDFHKWMSVNYEAGCVLIRDRDAHRRSFSVGGDYLEPLPRGLASVRDMAAGRGLQLSRGFKALKAWMMIREHGLDKLGRMVAKNVRQAEHLAARIDASEVLERAAPVALNVVAFRAAGDDALNRELLMSLQESGFAVVSSTVLDGRFTLRACICNHRTQTADLDALVERLEALTARRAPSGYRPSSSSSAAGR